jgi:hypothetical protein
LRTSRSNHLNDAPMNTRPAAIAPARAPLIVLLTGLALTACGTLKARAEAVQITASDRDVAACKNVGPVLLGTYDSEFDARQRDLKFETARQGGNVLLVDSYATATTGTAYVCDQPLSADRVAS